MKILLIPVVVLLFVGAVLLFWRILLRPRQGQPGWDAIAAFRYAHRGLHDKNRPENSLAAFRAAVEAGFGAELDVHLMADGRLAVVHDSDLIRVCGKRAVIEDLTAADLRNYPLANGEPIPLLEEVLDLFVGKTPLIVELKAYHGNAAALTDAVMARLAVWKGTYCVESFHPAVLLRLKKRYPAVLRGQLSEDFVHRKEGLHTLLGRFVLTQLLTTAFTRPDFIAYNYEDRACASLRKMRQLYGVREVGWTIRDPKTLEALEQDGVIPIFEGFLPDG